MQCLHRLQINLAILSITSCLNECQDIAYWISLKQLYVDTSVPGPRTQLCFISLILKYAVEQYLILAPTQSEQVFGIFLEVQIQFFVNVIEIWLY